MKARVTNRGNGAAYRWTLVLERLLGDGANAGTLKFDPEEFPRHQSSGSISLDDTILPSLSRMDEQHPIGFYVDGRSQSGVFQHLHRIFTPSLALQYRVVSEISAGEAQHTHFREVIDLATFASEIIEFTKK